MKPLANNSVFLCCTMVFVSCTNKKHSKEKEVVVEELFTVLGFEDTGLDFINKLEETT